MNSCIHCMGVKKNEIGETVVLCEHSGRWENVTLGDCFGNCEAQEFSRDYIASRIEGVGCSAYGWHIDNKVFGIPVDEFERLMDVAASMIRE